MTFPDSNPRPPFTVTRAGHMVLTVRDLEASARFYTEVIGLVISARDDTSLHLRGVEESAHHSLVLHQSAEAPTCLRMGYRVSDDAQLDLAHAWFGAQGLASRFVDAPFQARTLQVEDPSAIPLEFVASMPTEERLHDKPHLQKGGAALRYDHTQILAPELTAVSAFYLDLGFRVSDWFVDKEGDVVPFGIFLYRKTNPHDVVFLKRPGPVLHHFAYVVQDSAQLFRALDTAGHIGLGHTLERGPGRHGEGHALYVYFRDPDGHRVELMTAPIQMGDADDVPHKWHRGNRHSWEFAAPKSWLYEATPFKGVTITGQGSVSGLRSLEDVLAARPLNIPT